MAKHLSEKEQQWQKEYSHQRRRIRQAVKRQQAKGYDISLEDIFPKRPEQLSQGYISYLQEISPEKLREKSNIRTNKKKTTEEIFEEARRKKDRRILEKMEQEEQFAKQFEYGVLAFQELTSRIDELAFLSDDIKSYVEFTLNQEINDYGFDAVMRNIESMPEELITETERVLRYATQDTYKVTQVIKLLEVITGTILSSEQTRNLTKLFDTTVPLNDL